MQSGIRHQVTPVSRVLARPGIKTSHLDSETWFGYGSIFISLQRDFDTAALLGSYFRRSVMLDSLAK